MLVPVILAGGSGTRLWPLSRQQFPKQFLNLFGDKSMLQETILRLNGISRLADPIVVCNEDHRFTVADQLQQIKMKGSILLEPAARNTAPAIALAALHAKTLYEDPMLLVLPADHLIKDVQAFHAAIALARDSSEKGNLTTFGIVPSRPETGYGYIKIRSGQPSLGSKLLAESGKPCLKQSTVNSEFSLNSEQLAVSGKQQPAGVFVVERFVEKPNEDAAKEYLEAGCYLWNSGMFVFKASSYVDALNKFSGECLKSIDAAYKSAKQDLNFLRVSAEDFKKSPSVSIDYAVMEKADNVECVPLDAGWSDVGCWQSYWEASEKDEDGNSLIGDALTVSTKNTLIYSKDKLVATVGLNNVVVINTADAVLVIDKSHAQQVKHAIEFLSDADRTEHITHREVQRPWGSYDSIDFGERFQVKRITVRPGASLSLQMHHHRAEHWIVVKGTAIVQRGEEEVLLSENESTFIPLGVKHRLTNPGKVDLELIEVQSGSYLGEDDIVRFDDTYGRA